MWPVCCRLCGGVCRQHTGQLLLVQTDAEHHAGHRGERLAAVVARRVSGLGLEHRLHLLHTGHRDHRQGDTNPPKNNSLY